MRAKQTPESSPRGAALDPANRGSDRSSVAPWRTLAWNPIRNFAGADGTATYLWPRWIVLRLVGVIFILAFAGIIQEGMALVGPDGLAPIGGFLGEISKLFESVGRAFWHAPSVFWLGHGASAISVVAWTGLIAAVALTINVAPRWMLLVCWVSLLSFVTTWQVFTSTQVDQLALETALLLIPFAPSGWRPGLGASSPPRSLAVFMVRWLLFRVMFECGVMKLTAGDYHWFDLSAMDVLYETAPFPTPLAFWDHQLPHAWHVIEALLTFGAELVAPFVAIFGGRRGRWFAFVIWSLFQAGIQVTCNFGWLNTAALVLGILLLDDQMLATAWSALRRRKPAVVLPALVSRPLARWKLGLFRSALWLHFALTIAAFAAVLYPPEDESARGALLGVTAPWHSANSYTLYGSLLPWRFSVEFAGSNDGGRTWRAWKFHHQPQSESDISGFFAPWYARFEATLQAQANSPDPKDMFGGVAAHLIARTPAVMALFSEDPFPDHPPTLVRIRGYRMSFVDAATHRATGKYWHREDVGDFRPMMYRDETGHILLAASQADDLQALALNGNPAAQAALAQWYAEGKGGSPQISEALKWGRRAAEQGDVSGQLFLGVSYLAGQGVPTDKAEAARWLKLAAEQGSVPAQFNLAVLLYRGDGVRRDPVEALTWFDVAARSGDEQAMQSRDGLARELGSEQAAEASRRGKVIADRIAAKNPGS